MGSINLEEVSMLFTHKPNIKVNFGFHYSIIGEIN